MKKTGIAAAGVALGGCRTAEDDSRKDRRKPNIVFVLTDQWRAQAFGYAGDPNVKTPNIDALAARSVSFGNAISVCPVCTPHRASLLTGRYPTTTGMFMNDLYLPAEELCMAEMFKKGGYNTAYIGKWHLDGHGRDTYIPPERRQGFDYWKVLECTHRYNKSHYYAGNDPKKRTWPGYDAYAQTKDAVSYIRDHAKDEKPFLLFVGYGGPHFPHDSAPEKLKALYPPDKIELRPNVTDDMKDRARKELQGYYGHCTALDQCIGDLHNAIEETGEADSTIFVFTSDHGDMHGSQGEKPYMKQVPWDESVRIPFLLRYPDSCGDKGKVVRAPLNTPDILPTLLSLAGVEIPETIEGEDLSGFMTGTRKDEDRAALFMMVAPFAGCDLEAYRGIRTMQYSYIRTHDGPWLLYDNQSDPYQMKNLADLPEHSDLQKELDSKLQTMLKERGDKFPTKAEAVAAWGYTLGQGRHIPYHGEGRKTQTPVRPQQ